VRINVSAVGLQSGSTGNSTLLDSPLLALFCSVKCPGSIILKTFDLMKELRDKQVGVISGFHAPMDKECLDILLRGKGPVVWCPARSIEKMRLSAAYRQAIEAGRLLLLSPFPPEQSRISAERAELRNRFVAGLAKRVFVAYASPGGKVEALCRELAAAGKPLFTFEDPHNANLLSAGARPVQTPGELVADRQ